MSDLERELRATLDDRAGRVESDLTGPELRRLAAVRATAGRGRVRRAAPVLASAAAVAALGVGAALLAAPGDTPPPVEPAGPRPATVSPADPSTPARQTPLPTVPQLPLRTATPVSPSRPAVSGLPSVVISNGRRQIVVPAVPSSAPTRSRALLLPSRSIPGR